MKKVGFPVAHVCALSGEGWWARMAMVRGQPSLLEQALGVHAGHFAVHRVSKWERMGVGLILSLKGEWGR